MVWGPRRWGAQRDAGGSEDEPDCGEEQVYLVLEAYSWLFGFVKEVGVATLTGKVAETGVSRELKEQDIEKARSMAEWRVGRQYNDLL